MCGFHNSSTGAKLGAQRTKEKKEAEKKNV